MSPTIADNITVDCAQRKFYINGVEFPYRIVDNVTRVQATAATGLAVTITIPCKELTEIHSVNSAISQVISSIVKAEHEKETRNTVGFDGEVVNTIDVQEHL
ncbi:hypothetical protein [Nocardia gipuzkoensis]